MFSTSSLRTPLFWVSVSLIGLLSACGGGGGSASSTSASTPGALIYSEGSPLFAVSAFLNQERSRCGFGTLVQNGALNSAAAAHANYLSQATASSSDDAEVVGVSGFTGATVQARASVAGYAGSLGEAVGFARSGQGLAALRGELAMPYRGAVLLGGARDVGLGYAESVPFITPAGAGALVIDVGVATGQTDQSVIDVVTYPCEGSSGMATIGGETQPQPLTGAQPSWGQPIFVKAATGHSLIISSATVTEVTTGGAVIVQKILTQANDGNGLYPAYLATIIPEGLKSGTQYSVFITGTDNGLFFSRAFQFTTG